MSIPLEQPVVFVIVTLVGLFLVWRRVRQKGAIGFSSETLLTGMRIKLPLLGIEKVLLSVFVLASALVIARPVQYEKISVPVYKNARDITIVLDISGSMGGESMDTATKVIAEFVAGRPGDQIALFVFDTEAHMEWPLSLDHNGFIYRLNNVGTGGGTTISVGVIAGLTHQLKYGLHPGAVIVVSDGSSELSPEEKTAIEAVIGQTKLYFIQIGDPDDYARSFWAYVKTLGGAVYNGKIGELGDIFTEISKLETSPVVWEQHVKVKYEFGMLPVIAILALLAAGLVIIIKEV